MLSNIKSKFVNRETFIEDFRQLVGLLSRGEIFNTPVLISYIGTSGIGKTTLLNEYEKICHSNKQAFYFVKIDLLKITSISPYIKPNPIQLLVMKIDIMRTIVSSLMTGTDKANYFTNCFDTLQKSIDIDISKNEKIVEDIANKLITSIIDQKGFICFDSMERIDEDLLHWIEFFIICPLLKNTHGYAIIIASKHRVEFKDIFLKMNLNEKKLDYLSAIDSMRLSERRFPHCAEKIFKITRGFPLLDVILSEALNQIEIENKIKITNSNFDSYEQILFSKLLPAIKEKIFGQDPEEVGFLYRVCSPMRIFDFDLLQRLIPLFEIPNDSASLARYLSVLEKVGLISYYPTKHYAADYAIRRLIAIDFKNTSLELFQEITCLLVSYYDEKVKKEYYQIGYSPIICEWAFHFVQKELLEKKNPSEIEQKLLNEFIKLIDNAPNQFFTTNSIYRDIKEDWEFLELFPDNGQIIIEKVKELNDIQQSNLNIRYVQSIISISAIESSPDLQIQNTFIDGQHPINLIQNKRIDSVTLKTILRGFEEKILNYSKKENPLAKENIINFENELKTCGNILYTRLLTTDIQEKMLNIDEKSTLSLQVNRCDIPWEILYDGDDFLCTKHNLSRVELTPKLHSFYTSNSDSNKKLLIIADPNNDLPETIIEAEIIMSLFNGLGWKITPLINKDANYSTVSQILTNDSFGLIHFAGHATFTSESTTQTGITLNNLDLFSIEDIISSRLKGNPIVFLNACESGKSDSSSPLATYTFNFTSNLVASFLQGGASACIGTMLHIPDQGARLFAETFYEYFLKVKMSLGIALRETRRCIKPKSHPFLWFSYMLYGNPNIYMGPNGLKK